MIRLLNREGDGFVELGRRSEPDELSYALEAPIWERFGTFAGHPLVCGEIVWRTADRRIVITARRGDRRSEELVG